MINKFKIWLTTVAFSIVAIAANGQNTAVGIGTAQPDASSILELKTQSKGFLPPRMTSAERIAIATPATGLVVYQTDAPDGIYTNSGTPGTPVWSRLTTQTTSTYGNFTCTSNQSIPTNGSFQVANLNVTNASSNMGFNPSTHEITIQAAGAYDISHTANIFVSGSAQAGCRLFKNGNVLSTLVSIQASQGNFVVTDRIFSNLAVGDIITLRCVSVNLAGGISIAYSAVSLRLID